MTKTEFTRILKTKIAHLPRAERKKILQYYNEMITERMEDGMTEAEAIEALGDIDELVGAYAPAPAQLTQRKSTRLRAWHIVMLAVGSPLWISIVAALFCIMVAIYIVVWALVVAFYAIFAALAVSGFACIMSSFIALFSQGFPAFAALMGAGCLLMGFALLWLVPCNLFAKAAGKMSGKLPKFIFRFFFKRK